MIFRQNVIGLIAILVVLVVVGSLALWQEMGDGGANGRHRGTIEGHVIENISELSPEKEMVGGTFYVTKIEVENGKGYVEYEDGHNAYVADFTYDFDGEGAPRVTAFTIRGNIPDVPAKSTLSGVFTCLPHKGPGPHTLECAFGIRVDDGAHYALDLNSIPFETYSALPTGSRVSGSGLLVPLEQLSSDQWRKYDIRGILRVESLKRL